MIRVLHIHTLPVISGSGLNTFLTMRGMHGRGYETDLACAPRGSLIQLVESNGMRVIPFPHLVQPLHPGRDVLALCNLIRYLRSRPYHIVHTHNSKAGFLGRLAAKAAGIPVIVHTVHGFAFHDQEPFWRRALFRKLERTASGWCDRMIFISQPLVDWAVREGVTKREKTVTIYSGIELDRFRPVSPEEKDRLRDRWGLARKAPVVGMVSKLWEGKGHSVLFPAFRGVREALPDARLVIVGEGYLKDRLVREVAELGLAESVLFAGFVTEPSQIIATLDVAVLPSFFEGMGRVLLEAMAMGKPVVATRVGGIPDLVKQGVNGLLVSPGSVPELRDALLRLLKDKETAGRMGNEGKNRVTETFGADRMVRSIEGVYRQLLAAKGIPLDG
ncbi:MAG: glycosyltransferase family 4 protein [Thermodesulfobacteriota bacterium]